jgi:predicted GNAT family N-acyltransferase
MTRFDVRVCKTETELQSVQRLRYEIYVEEMGRPQPHADHVNRRITDDLDAHGHVLGIEADGELAGTLRVNLLSDGVGKYEDLYGLSDLSESERKRHVIVTALMLRPSVRHAGAVKALFLANYALCRSLGADSCWIDCNEPLVPMFLHYGFRSVTTIPHPLYGQVRLMRGDLLDRAYFTETRSPFLTIMDNPTPHLPRSFRLNTMDRLRADFTKVAARFHTSPAVIRLLAGEATLREYASLMSAIALQARENPQIQAFATAFFRGHQRDQVRAFYKHAVSEIGHDQLAANDAAAVGFPTDDLFQQQPIPSTVALTAYAYYTITHHSPVSYLGYLFFLEFLPTAFGAEYMIALDKIGVPPTARTFLLDHATIDIGHNKLMERYVEALIITEEDYESVRYAMEVTGALYARMFDEAFELAHTLGEGRAIAHAERTTRPAAREIEASV